MGKVCCSPLLALVVGDVCPLCGRIVPDDAPNKPAETPTASNAVRIGCVVRAGFRLCPEHDAVSAGLAEQRLRKAQRQDGSFRPRPAKKRRAMPGPQGRKGRKGMVRVG